MRLERLTSAKAVVVIAIASVITFAGLATLKGASKPAASNADKRIAKDSNITSTAHGAYGDAFDDTSDPGVSLKEALEKMEGKVSLPDASVVGQPLKVVLDTTTHEDTGLWGMGVLYVSGIKLWIQPGEENFKEALNRQYSPYTDGRKKVFEERLIGGRPSLVNPGGIQIVHSNGRYRVHPIIIWNMNGRKYRLRTDSEEVSLGDLIKAAQSIE